MPFFRQKAFSESSLRHSTATQRLRNAAQNIQLSDVVQSISVSERLLSQKIRIFAEHN